MAQTLSGTILEGRYTSTRYYPGSVFSYRIHVPVGAADHPDCGLLINHDGLSEPEALAMEQLAATGEAPCCITVGIFPATLPAAVSGGTDRGMRMQNYDIYGPTYPDFVVEELLPWLVQTHGLSFSSSPDMHMTSGGSSGGISAWNMAWYRTDYFHRVSMSSPSFLSMGHGHELPHLIRKVETKPIRVFTEYSETEPDDYFGSSLCVAMDAERSLRFAGYDMVSAYYPGEGHSSRYRHPETILERMRFLWKNWDREPVTVKALSPRAALLISPDMPWEKTDAFPEKVPAVSTGIRTAAGTYIPDGERILFRAADGTERTAAEGFSHLTALAVSPDKWRLYAGDCDRGCVYALTIHPDGSLDAPYLHAALHMETDFRHPGALDLCVSSDDRVYAATECGIQAVRSFGLIDVIVPLPDRQIPLQIAFGTEDTPYLYARSRDGIYRRRWLSGGRICPDATAEPQYTSYYN